MVVLTPIEPIAITYATVQVRFPIGISGRMLLPTVIVAESAALASRVPVPDKSVPSPTCVIVPEPEDPSGKVTNPALDPESPEIVKPVVLEMA